MPLQDPFGIIQRRGGIDNPDFDRLFSMLFHGLPENIRGRAFRLGAEGPGLPAAELTGVDPLGVSGGLIPQRREASPSLASIGEGSGLGGMGLGGLLPLLENSPELDQLGPLFRTLLALQTGGRGTGDQLATLFSSIEL